MYAKDCSKKIRAVWKAKGSAGERLAAVPVYGYKKDSENPRHLLVDEEAAPIVKRIFKMCLSGMGPTQIANTLEAQKVLRPSYHLNNIGMNHRTDLGKNPYGWDGTVVADILECVDYLGYTVNFKYQSKSHKCHRAVKRPKEEQMIFYNTHEPIISREDWDMVQSICSGKRRKKQHRRSQQILGIALLCRLRRAALLSLKAEPEQLSLSMRYIFVYSYKSGMFDALYPRGRDRADRAGRDKQYYKYRKHRLKRADGSNLKAQ